MPTPKRGTRLGGSSAHQKMMLSNLASDLFRHGRIKTTHAKAKTLRPYAEKLITKAKQGDLPARRLVLSKLRDRDVVAYLFEDVAPRFADRPGGYTRILKLGPRPGDNAPMALIELVEQGVASGEEVIEEGKKRRSRGIFGRRRREAAPPEPAYDFDGLDDEDEVAEDTSSGTSEGTSSGTSEVTSSGTSEGTSGDDSGDESSSDVAADEDDEPSA